MEFIMKPIGVIHSPFTEKKQTPIQPTRSNASGFIEVFPEFAEGLQGLEGFSHLILLYVFHQSNGYNLLVKPFLDDQIHGILPRVIHVVQIQLVCRSSGYSLATKIHLTLKE
jgi:tRNA (Thr-GGU) A37 N-methylase